MKSALIVGVNTYFDHQNLNCSVNDAISVEALLGNNEDGSKNFKTSLVIADDEVSARKLTKDSLMQKCTKLFSSEGDTVLFYFSGHGVPTASGVQLCLPRYNFKTRDGIEFEKLITLANNSPARSKVIILDCCYAGGIGSLCYRPDEVNIKNGITVLASSRSTEESEETTGHGVFTQLLVNSLSGEAADITGNISPASVYAHIDKSLSWEFQRPLYFANNSHFISLRTVYPAVDPNDLRAIINIFSHSDSLPLNPTFESDPPEFVKGYEPIEKNVRTFGVLQRLNRVNLVVPSTRAHMYDEAMNFGACKLTRQGKFYKKLLMANML